MRTRQGLLEIFSTFLQFKADDFSNWVADPTLRRSMQTRLNQFSQEASEVFWAAYWYRVWQTQASQLAAAHITAYLQEVCYWTARKLALKITGRHSIADFFQIAIARIDKVLKHYDPQFNSSLKSYAELVLSGVIKNQIEKQHEAEICTDWALLHKTSHKRLVEALQFAGESRDAIARYVLAWNCFKELYVPSNAQTAHRLSKPTDELWQAIAQVYNAEHLNQFGSAQSCNPAMIETWLLACAKAVRAFLYPGKISIHTPIGGQNSGQEPGELLDHLPGSIQESLLAEAIAQEETITRETQSIQINQILKTALTQLNPDAQTLLQLYYQQGLTQQQIAQHLGVKQYVVSRQLQRLRKTLLLALAKWSQQTLHISLNSTVLDSMSSTLEEWLNAHYCPSTIGAMEPR
jgi:RNA polymerase sigma factor (sigma-70 family)